MTPDRDPRGGPQCTEAIQHGPADGAGHCPWCGIKYDKAIAEPRRQRMQASELTLAYQEHYDPDFGSLSPADVKGRYLMGLSS